MPQSKIAIVWFRQDLRLSDNPAFFTACQKGYQIIPLFIWSPLENGDWPEGGASKWWLHQSLKDFSSLLKSKKLSLILRKGKSLLVLKKVISETGASAVYWNRAYESFSIERDKEVKTELKNSGIEVESFNGHLLCEPWTIQNKQGRPFKVYTAFWNHLTSLDISPPLEAPKSIQPYSQWTDSLTLDELELEPRIDWAKGMKREWNPGRKGAESELKRFVTDGLSLYEEGRDRPDLKGTSRLSPHLHFGEISAREIWHHIKLSAKTKPYLRQIAWREFSYHLLFHFPNTASDNLRENFNRFPWLKSALHVRAWQKGKTGYPIVDAGMRELWTTGWIHNRVRMIAASFLVKHLLIHWHEGAVWFWDTLVDADLPNNTMGWQWVAGSGADAAPYFRIFNPILQGEKFDPQGNYVRRWVPELSKVPQKWIHRPWEAPLEILEKAGVDLGKNYPKPIVDHEFARRRALQAYEKIK